MYSLQGIEQSGSRRDPDHAHADLNEELLYELLRRLRAPVSPDSGNDAEPAERIRKRLDAVLGVGGYADAYEVVPAAEPTVVCRLNVQGLVRTGIACATTHEEAQDRAFLKAAGRFGIHP